MSTLTPRRRSFVAVIALVVALACASAACGIDEDKVATGGTTSTEPGSHTTTSNPGGPQISLPDIPPDVTESTEPDPTTTETIPAGESTPNGLTVDDLAEQLVNANLTEQQAECVATGIFAEFDGETIDKMVTIDDLGELGGDIEQRFTAIVTKCVQGG